ncbi:MAG TPA: hypothetical protein VJP86_07940 [Vicinamibacterales bacterium]|jgi:hypothetical protein|nr:hypothetical protein [Vicinamibacterales bacterium]
MISQPQQKQGQPGAQHEDPDAHKGAVEGNRPEDRQNSNPHGSGIGPDGLPNDPIAQAEDEIGANVDQTQG